MKIKLTSLFIVISFVMNAAVPLRWTVETSRLQPVVFDAARGETLHLEAEFNSYGNPLSMTNYPCCIFWQTNGMGSAWWVASAAANSNLVSAAFTPQMDPGSASVNCFIGSTGEIYRAAFTIRFRHGPGAAPNALDTPPRVLDLAHTVVVNPPWPTTNDFISATNVMQGNLKNYVESKIEEAGVVTPQGVSNIVDRKIAEIPKDGVSTNAVSGIITNSVNSGYLCTVSEAQEMTNTRLPANQEYEYGPWNVNDYILFNKFVTIGPYSYIYCPSWSYYVAGSNQELPSYLSSLAWHPSNVSLSSYGITNAIPSKTSELANDSGFMNQSGVDSRISATAYPNSSGQQLAVQVATQGSHLNAEDAQFISTNYDSVVNMPEAYVRIKLQNGGTNVWMTIWEEMRRWNAFTGIGFNWQTWGGFHAWSTNMLSLINETSPKEYAFYDGTTGEVAPDGFFWISQPRIAICAGASYQRHLDAGGAVWILESNGLVANIGGTTNGYFRISDEEGNTQFEIVKGDKQTVPAIARSVRSETVMGVTHWICDYAVTNALEPPVAKFCRNLGANPPVWIADTEASCPCNVTWTPGVNTYTLEFWPKSNEPTMFCKAEYDRGGKTRIRQSVPVEMQTIMIGGTEYSISVTTIDGKKVPQLTEVN